MNVSEQYEAGLWVPSYYGLKFTVAKKYVPAFKSDMKRPTEIDISVKASTLIEVQKICDQRNSA